MTDYSSNNPQIDSQKMTSPFTRGDIFIVVDQGKQGGELPSLSWIGKFIKTLTQSQAPDAPPLENTAPVIQWLLSLSRNENPHFTHAGIIVGDNTLVEMTGQGIKLGTIAKDLCGKKVIRFHCNDEEVAQLAADLAVNMEASVVKEKYPSLSGNKKPIAYNYIDAAKGLFSQDFISKEEHAQNYKKFVEMAETMDIPSQLFCSQLVVYTFTLSHLLLLKPNKMDLPLNTNPSVLHDYLITNPDYTHETVNIASSLKKGSNNDAGSGKPFKGRLHEVIQDDRDVPITPDKMNP